MNNAFLGHSIVAFIDTVFLNGVRLLIILKLPRVVLRYLRLPGAKFLPNPANPTRINDIFFWRKVFDHDPRFSIVSDKLAVRTWLKDHGIDVEAPEVVWTGDDPGSIPEHLWSPDFVLKTNNGWNTNIFLSDLLPDRDKVMQRARSALRHRHGGNWHETFYWHITPRLFLERVVPGALSEMKFYTFGDNVVRVWVSYDRDTNFAADIWKTDADGNLFVSDEVSITAGARANRPLPPVADRAHQVAKKIGRHFDHMRVDFLTDGRELWFSELTVTNLGGHMAGLDGPPVHQLERAWDIRGSWFMTTPQSGWRRLYKAALLRRLEARSVNPGAIARSA